MQLVKVPIIRVVFLSLLFVCVAANAPNAEEASEFPLVKVYADLTPTVRYYDREGRAAGAFLDKVREVMDASGLSYEIILVPWSRAYALAQTDPYALIFNLNRTLDREDKFQWLVPLENAEYRLFTTNTPDKLGLSLAEATDGSHDVLCEKDSAQCKMAVQLGFPAENVIPFVDAGTRTGGLMLARGRADFILTNASLLETGILPGTLPAGSIVPVFEPIRSGTWLAIHNSAHPRLIEFMTKHAAPAEVSP